jgi:hypothetical protein
MTRPTRDVLREIARRALLQRGFLPEFSAEARAEARAAAPPPPDPAVRDLRALPWCSIDNDDSRDLTRSWSPSRTSTSSSPRARPWTGTPP